MAYEALARWTQERLGAIALADFNPMTEQMQLVEPISQALPGRAAHTALAWAPEQQLSFDLSAVRLCSSGSAQRVLRCNKEAGITLDDFGEGHASINYLREMRFDEFKLDGSLLAASQRSEGARLLKGIVDLARAIETPCTAEHVETVTQIEYLASIGCVHGQGRFLGPPVTAEADAWLAYVRLALGERRGRTSPARRLTSGLVDGLDDLVGFEAFLAAFGAEAAVLDPAKRGIGGRDAEAVDPDHPGLDRVAE